MKTSLISHEEASFRDMDTLVVHKCFAMYHKSVSLSLELASAKIFSPIFVPQAHNRNIKSVVVSGTCSVKKEICIKLRMA